MRELPTGIVTFLFTDLEGSTRLLERLGARYREIQDRHNEIMRAAIAAGGGFEVGTEGDSFFAVFPHASGALRAAVGAQLELAGTRWPHEATVRVRMGLHTGDGIPGGDDYLGLDVNRAARISAAAHGGQVLLSDATRGLVERSLPPGARLRDLALHRLKDLSQPERLFEVVIEGHEQRFPPPRTLDARPNNLPAQLTRLVGRTGERTQVRELVARNRLVTLTGPGGTGKTRLALEVAAAELADSADGVFFVDLSAVTDPELVPAAIAEALSLREEPGQSIAALLLSHLEDKKPLLILDNVEQVVDAAPYLESLLGAAPGVRSLVTSRVPLHLRGEQEFPVPPLTMPDLRHLPDLAAVARCEAVALFAERAAAAKPDFRLTPDNVRAVAEIVARLDGLPLAIELAASRIRLLPPRELLDRLEQRLPLLAARDRKVPERQRTLRGAIEWSYDLLPEADQRMFCRLSVFAGGFDLDAFESVVDPQGELGDALDGLTTLVDSSLVRTLDAVEDQARFGMLETIREYAGERLAEGPEESVLRRRHAEHLVETAERAAEAPAGDEDRWTRRLEREHDNLRSALSWVMEAGEAELGLRLGAALADFWRRRSQVREAVRWLTGILALPGAAGTTAARARALTAAGAMYAWLADPRAYLRSAEEALAIYRELDDAHGVAVATSQLGWAQLQTGNLEGASDTLAEARRLHTGLGNTHEAADVTNGLAIVATIEQRLEEARQRHEEALAMFTELDDSYWVALTECMLGGVDRAQGRQAPAEQRCLAGLAGFRRIGNVMGASWALYQLADLDLLRGRPERALRLAGASDGLRGGTELPALVAAMIGDVRALAGAGLAEAEELYREGLAMEFEEAVAYALGDG